jgi:hypothetical protein
MGNEEIGRSRRENKFPFLEKTLDIVGENI